MSSLKTVLKEDQIAEVQNGYNLRICACNFLHHDSWNSTFKAIMEKPEYKSLSFEL